MSLFTDNPELEFNLRTGMVADSGLSRGLPFAAMAPFGPLYLRQRATPG